MTETLQFLLILLMTAPPTCSATLALFDWVDSNLKLRLYRAELKEAMSYVPKMPAPEAKVILLFRAGSRWGSN